MQNLKNVCKASVSGLITVGCGAVSAGVTIGAVKAYTALTGEEIRDLDRAILYSTVFGMLSGVCFGICANLGIQNMDAQDARNNLNEARIEIRQRILNEVQENNRPRFEEMTLEGVRPSSTLSGTIRPTLEEHHDIELGLLDTNRSEQNRLVPLVRPLSSINTDSRGLEQATLETSKPSRPKRVARVMPCHRARLIKPNLANRFL